MKTRETRQKLETVAKILEYTEYTGNTTIKGISNVVFNVKDNKHFQQSTVKPLLDALVLTGKLTRLDASIESYYNIAK